MPENGSLASSGRVAQTVLRVPHVASGRNSGFDVIFFCLGKRPGGSDSNRVFSMSEPKSEFFRGTLFFQVEDRSEAQTFTCKYSEKCATLRRCCARTPCQAARFSV